MLFGLHAFRWNHFRCAKIWWSKNAQSSAVCTGKMFSSCLQMLKHYIQINHNNSLWANYVRKQINKQIRVAAVSCTVHYPTHTQQMVAMELHNKLIRTVLYTLNCMPSNVNKMFCQSRFYREFMFWMWTWMSLDPNNANTNTNIVVLMGTHNDKHVYPEYKGMYKAITARSVVQCWRMNIILSRF